MIVYVMWLSDKKESNYCDYVVHTLVKHFLSPPGEERLPMLSSHRGELWNSLLGFFTAHFFIPLSRPASSFDFQHSFRCLFFMLLFYTF